MTLAPSRDPGSPTGSAAAGSASGRSGAAYDRADWASAFRNVLGELDRVPLNAVRGTIPPDLAGTLYRNGPGRLERGGHWLHHPFDGDGMITALRFEAGQAVLTNRFVRTEGWLEEEAAGRFLYRGVFGSQKPGGLLANAFDLRMKNIANTHVVRLGDQLLALWEASSPHALDPDTLETRGLTLLDGVLGKGEAFSAHPRFDPGHHGEARMVTFGVKAGPRSTIRLMEFAASGPRAGQLLADRHDSVAGFAFLHDFAITPRYAVFLQNAVAFNPLPFVAGLKGAAQCLASKPGEQGHFLIVPRPGATAAGDSAAEPTAPIVVPAPEGFVFHHLNAFEDAATGELVVDSIFYDDFPSIDPGVDFRAVDFDTLPAGRLVRTRIDLEHRTAASTVLEERCCEFAMVNPERQGLDARYGWTAVAECERGNAPLQAIEKLDLHTCERRVWSAAPRGFVSEPVMVPRPATATSAPRAEDDGWVLNLVWNGARCASDLVILHAADLSEQAVLELPLAIPYGLHGSWAPLG
ncbi:carotenoid oxygenase family protein [Synechococcus sp. CBW1002]|uniref:carotenoid oxygenase family protein n=1 Tax=Synechococcus sp. CBW1002 TaxID=1353134 RepID=UPI0018CD5544|nr:carotenoid oxygenase family protein [Synechococcus sp. CBW1002]QPN60738.1 carotenoid oxygenase family protein [Synechococcus sp. CBW1002]